MMYVWRSSIFHKAVSKEMAYAKILSGIQKYQWNSRRNIIFLYRVKSEEMIWVQWRWTTLECRLKV
eukprot:11257708-Ditylum_brightwellii.AAC.2